MSLDRMGLSGLAKGEQLWICDSCEGTWTGTLIEIQGLKWKVRQFGSSRLVLCAECEQSHKPAASAA